jgi:type IV pilus assembly protein PilN
VSNVRIPINLASEPFRRDRPILVASAAVAGLLALTLLIMIGKIVREHDSAADQRALVERLSAQVQRLSSQQNALDATLRQPENSVVLERSVFLNSLIQRKAISWTRIFSDLEKVMPYNVRLVSVRLPQVDNQNQVLLDMVVGADDSAPVLDFLKRLEKAPQFGPTSVVNSIPPSQTDKLWKYRISVNYSQTGPALRPAKVEEASAQ